MSKHSFLKEAKTSFSRLLCHPKFVMIGEIFYAQMMSCALHYDIIYHPSLISSQYLNTSGANSPAKGCSARRVASPLLNYLNV